MGTSRDELLSSMEKHSDDIGVANYLMERFAKDATLPGDILVWAARFDPEKIREAKGKLEPLLEEYRILKETKYDQLDTFKDNSSGDGPDAFAKRWEKLCRHVKGDDDVTGLYGYLKKLLDDMESLAEGAELFQSTCADNLSKLDGLRDSYCNALIDSALGKHDGVVEDILANGGLGATFGSGGGVPGIVIGGMMGGLLGMTSAFNNDSSAAADEHLSKIDYESVSAEVDKISTEIGKFLNPNRYGEIDGVTKWQGLGEDAIDGGWESS